MTTPHVSIVVPLYEEAENVHLLCAAVREALATWDRSYEVLLVDDGSRDSTLGLLEQEARRDPRLRVLSLARNAGQTAAMAAGFARARGAIVVSMDGDLQNDPRDIRLLVERVERGADVVCGRRCRRQDAWLSRTLPSRVANRLIAAITGVAVHDNGCTLKAFRAEVVRSLHLYSEMHRFLPALSSMTGARIEEVVVHHHPRLRGRSKYGLSRTVKVLGDMVTTKMVTQFATRPGRWFGLLALPCLVLAAGSAAVWLGSLWLLRVPPSVVLPALTLMLAYLAGHLATLALVSELYLAHADRRHLHRVVEALAAELRPRTAGNGAPGMSPEISVVCAVSRLAGDMREIHRRFAAALAATGRTVEFVYVVDGRGTAAEQALRQLDGPDPVRVFRMARGFGESAALAFGFARAQGRHVLTIGDRLQIEPRVIERVIEHLERGDQVVVTRREPRSDAWLNRLQNRVFHGLVRSLVRQDFRDLTCGVRGFSREAARRLDLYGDQHRFIPVIAVQAGFDVVELAAPQLPENRELRLRRPDAYGRRLLDALNIYFLVRFTRKPLRFFGSIGVGLFAMGSAITGALAAQRILGDAALAGRPLLLLGVLLMVFGVQLTSIGLLGEIIIFLSSRRAAPEVRELEAPVPEQTELQLAGAADRSR